MEKILLANGLPKETVTVIMMYYRNTKIKVHSLNGDMDFFNIVAGVTLATYLFIICQDYVLQTLIDLMKENGFTVKQVRSRLYPTETLPSWLKL